MISCVKGPASLQKHSILQKRLSYVMGNTLQVESEQADITLDIQAPL